MRETLFRGRPVHTAFDGLKDWIFGHIVYAKNGTRIYVSSLNDEEYVKAFLPVIPETVGQWTGKTDIKGVKIFEGDLVKMKSYNYQHLDKYTYEVYYCPDQMCFKMRNNIGFPHNFDDDPVGFHSFEVVGNIFDNQQ